MKYLERRTVVYCKASKQTGRAGGGGVYLQNLLGKPTSRISTFMELNVYLIGHMINLMFEIGLIKYVLL